MCAFRVSTLYLLSFIVHGYAALLCIRITAVSNPFVRHVALPLSLSLSAGRSMVQGLVNTVKDFLVDAKTGTVALWTNFQAWVNLMLSTRYLWCIYS